MTETFTRWDAADHLETPEDVRLYVQACADEDPGDGSLIRAALNDVARAGNMAGLAREAGMSREGLYKALSADGNPTFTTVLRITRALGIELRAEVAGHATPAAQARTTAGGTESNDRILAECAMIGLALLAAQRVEFLLYGLVAHIRDDLKQGDRRFHGLTPERFLRGDVSEMRATLGQLATAYGEGFLLSADDLTAFVKKRNLIAHDYWRLAKANIRGAEELQNPMGFVQGFLADCQRWERILRGVLANFKLAAARKVGDEDRSQLTADDLSRMDEYHEHARVYLSGRGRRARSPGPEESPTANRH